MLSYLRHRLSVRTFRRFRASGDHLLDGRSGALSAQPEWLQRNSLFEHLSHRLDRKRTPMRHPHAVYTIYFMMDHCLHMRPPRPPRSARALVHTVVAGMDRRNVEERETGREREREREREGGREGEGGREMWREAKGGEE